MAASRSPTLETNTRKPMARNDGARRPGHFAADRRLGLDYRPFRASAYHRSGHPCVRCLDADFRWHLSAVPRSRTRSWPVRETWASTEQFARAAYALYFDICPGAPPAIDAQGAAGGQALGGTDGFAVDWRGPFWLDAFPPLKMFVARKPL